MCHFLCELNYSKFEQISVKTILLNYNDNLYYHHINEQTVILTQT